MILELGSARVSQQPVETSRNAALGQPGAVSAATFTRYRPLRGFWPAQGECDYLLQPSSACQGAVHLVRLRPVPQGSGPLQPRPARLERASRQEEQPP